MCSEGRQKQVASSAGIVFVPRISMKLVLLKKTGLAAVLFKDMRFPRRWRHYSKLKIALE